MKSSAKTFDHSRSSLGLHGNDVCSHQFRPRSSSNDAPFLNVQKTFDCSRSSLGLHGMMSVHISSGLVLHQMTSDHNRSELGIQDHSNEQSSSKLVPKVVP
ncbi:hypothetical protein Tco_0069286 [Tanacetum coccineum]